MHLAEVGTVPVILPPEDTLIHDGPLFFVNVIGVHPPVVVAVMSIEPPAAFVTSGIDPQVSVAPGTVMVKDVSQVIPSLSVAFTTTV